MNTLPTETTPLSIFLVENHADTLKWLTMYLEQMGHTVRSATTLGEAVEALPKADCDVVLSDIGLPDGDGWELLERAKLPHPVFSIAMSGYGTGADQLTSRAAGFRHHLLKPFNLRELDKLLAAAAAELAQSK